MMSQDGIDPRAFSLWLDPNGPQGVGVDENLDEMVVEKRQLNLHERCTALRSTTRSRKNSPKLGPIIRATNNRNIFEGLKAVVLRPIKQREEPEIVVKTEDLSVMDLIILRRKALEVDFAMEEEDSDDSDWLDEELNLPPKRVKGLRD